MGGKHPMEECYFLQNKQGFEEQIIQKVTEANKRQITEMNKAQDERIDERLDRVEENIKEFMQNGFYKKFMQDVWEMNQKLIEKAMENSFGIKAKKIELWKAIGLALLGAFGIKLLDLLAEVVR
jgi:CHASE3 domain sensor protein